MKIKKRNPADSTTRNLRAEQKRNNKMALQIRKLDARVKSLEKSRRLAYYVSGDN